MEVIKTMKTRKTLIIAMPLMIIFGLAVWGLSQPQKQMRFSELTPEQCLDFVKAKGVELPTGFDEEYIGKITKDYLVYVEKTPDCQSYNDVPITTSSVIIVEYLKKIFIVAKNNVIR